MNIPLLSGIIDRRILINYQIDPEVLRKVIPQPFRPILVQNKGIAGICLIRLKNVRPKGYPSFLGIGSENGAHRIAVEWEEGGVLREGVFVPRRDTSSKITSWAGGRIFPGEQTYASYIVKEHAPFYNVQFKSQDGTSLHIKAEETDEMPSKSVFPDLCAASDFFKKGSVGYSPASNGFDGIELTIQQWKVSLLKVHLVRSSFFEDTNLFPKGSVTFDNALLMKNIEHEWKGLKKIYSAE